MKPHRFVLTAILMSFSLAALAQHEHASAPTPAAPSEAQKAFEVLKTLAGSWEGTLSSVPPMKEVEGKRVKVMIRETSRGNALMHEMTISGLPDDPITMLYLDAERLMLTHYCDAGNRPRMAGKSSPDGRAVAFEVIDVSGSTKRGHMADAGFTLVDANHHLEDWTFNFPGGKPIAARFDLQRTKDASGPFGQ
jgi:hypothetical protein